MISGKLPNDTVWWLSSDGLKIWIESRDIELDKFKEKVYTVVHGRIFHSRKEVGELTKSRLDSRRGKDAWIIKLDAILDIYPELLDEIKRKEIESKKKKRKKVIKSEYTKNKVEMPIKFEFREENKIENTDKIKEENLEKKEEVIKEVDKVVIKDLFDLKRPYTEWIKEEINKNEKGKVIIPIKDLKEKMGEEFLNMHDMRIYYGLKKILSTIGINVELRSSKSESVIILKKII